MMAGSDLPARLLRRPDGERAHTDLRHVGELLHAEVVTSTLGATALAAWLRRRIGEAAEDGADEDRARRLESDAEAVQVLTIHRSKGLEFPVVHLPFLWDFGRIPDDGFPVYHDPDHDDRLTVDVGGRGADVVRHRLLHAVEQRGEDLRLAYVALTRARHQAVLWWASSWDSRISPLGRLIATGDPANAVVDEAEAPPTEDEVEAWFAARADAGALAPGTISVSTATGDRGLRWTDAPATARPLAVNRFTRRLDADWRRTSYTAITATVHNGVVAEGEPRDPEPGDGTVDDEAMGEIDGTVDPDAGAGGTDGTGPAFDEIVPLADMPGGAAVGSLLHAVLEDADFAAPDLDAELERHLHTAQARGRVDIGDPARALAGVRAAIETPLGPLTGGRALRDVDRRHRLDELAFELPLGGGEHARGAAPTVAGIAALLRRRVPAGDPLAGYAERLDVPELQRDLRGFLTGAIDVVLRVPGDGVQSDRYVVVDHKTNWLGEPGEPLTVGHYRPAALAEAMQRAHYPLQALLYSVALHRYLRWRLRGYDPDAHLGGVLYLFLRGMTGRSVPHVGEHPCGVFSWVPPAGLVPDLSDLLDEGAP
jgi:exodeoxyribonuclease V beta subunit